MTDACCNIKVHHVEAHGEVLAALRYGGVVCAELVALAVLVYLTIHVLEYLFFGPPITAYGPRNRLTHGTAELLDRENRCAQFQSRPRPCD
jgi:hypothetical protein